MGFWLTLEGTGRLFMIWKAWQSSWHSPLFNLALKCSIVKRAKRSNNSSYETFVLSHLNASNCPLTKNSAGWWTMPGGHTRCPNWVLNTRPIFSHHLCGCFSPDVMGLAEAAPEHMHSQSWGFVCSTHNIWGERENMTTKWSLQGYFYADFIDVLVFQAVPSHQP